jgi:O-antigen ligase
MNTTMQALPLLPNETTGSNCFKCGLALALMALGFCLPLSVSGVGLALVVVLLILITGAPGGAWRLRLWREPIVTVGFVLFAWIAVRTLLASGFTEASLFAISQYHMLLLLPLLWAAFRLSDARQLFFWSLTAGALVLAVIYWIGFLLFEQTQVAEHWLGYGGTRLLVFMGGHRISAGFILALCAFLHFEHARLVGRHRWLGYSVAGLLALTVFFAIAGRTGHVIMLLLIACIAWRAGPARWRWIAGLVVPCACAMVALLSPSVQKRLRETRIEAYQYVQGASPQLSSTGARLELMHNAWLLAQRHVLAGVGFANFAEAHHKLICERYAGDPAREQYVDLPWTRPAHPHSEYLLQAVGGGLAALGLFLTWLVLPLVRAARQPSPQAGSLAGIALAFAVACVFNSLLNDFVEGHLYTVLLPWLLADLPPCGRSADCRSQSSTLTWPSARTARLSTSLA